MSKKRRENRYRNIARLRELWSERPVNLPPVEVIELDRDIHLRLTCEDRVWDYWPSTGRAWKVGHNDSLLVSVEDLFAAVTSGVEPTPVDDLRGVSAKERRVLDWLTRH